MDFVDALMQAAVQGMNAQQPTDLQIGTVTAESPLEISIDSSMDTLKQSVLYLTESVIEKKIPVLKHKHKIKILPHTHIDSRGGTTTSAFPNPYYLTEDSAEAEGYDSVVQAENFICWEDGKELPVKDGYIILNRKLEEGDKVLLLRVQSGQKFIVLSRVFERGDT